MNILRAGWPVVLAAGFAVCWGCANSTPEAGEPAAGQTDKLPQDPVEAYNRGVARAEQEKFDKAIAAFTGAIESDPRYADAYCGRGAAFLKKGFPQIAIADLTTAIHLKPRYVEALCCRGRAYLLAGTCSLAMEDCRNAIRLSPECAGAYEILGRAHLESDQSAEANKCFQEAIRLDPELEQQIAAIAKGGRRPPAERPLAEGHCKKGIDHWKNKETQKAIAEFTEAIKDDPEYAEAYYRRGVAYLSEPFPDPDSAIKDFEQAIDLNEKYADAYCERGRAYLMVDNPHRAIADCTNAIRFKSGYAEAYGNRGEAHLQEENYARAIADFSNAINLDERLRDKLNPKLAQAHKLRDGPQLKKN